jgi:hypothetical protein
MSRGPIWNTLAQIAEEPGYALNVTEQAIFDVPVAMVQAYIPLVEKLDVELPPV